jgi:hypothetical protein
MRDFTLFRTSVTHQIAGDVLAAEWAGIGRYRLGIVSFNVAFLNKATQIRVKETILRAPISKAVVVVTWVP